MARYEMKALMAERQLAVEEPGVPMYPTMEQVFQRLPASRSGSGAREVLGFAARLEARVGLRSGLLRD